MTPITKILVPVDLSARSPGVAAYAASLASHLGSEVVLLHVLQNGWPLGKGESEIRDTIIVSAGARRFLFREGSPAQVIVNIAEAEKADLILIPTRGQPPLARFIDGSVTAQVLRGVQCPVWVGTDNLLPLSSRPIRSVLCGLSLGPRASAVLRWSADLAKRFNAGLSVIHASKGVESSRRLLSDRDWQCCVEKMAADEIRALQAGLGADTKVWLKAGRPLATIPPLAEQLRADLLVIGRSPQKRILGDLRTLSYELARLAPCPVASV